MPYTQKKLRVKYFEILDCLPPIETKGDLEACAFKLMRLFMETREYRYSHLHDCVYAVYHSAHEFERRFLDKRENEARKKNGDIE